MERFIGFPSDLVGVSFKFCFEVISSVPDFPEYPVYYSRTQLGIPSYCVVYDVWSTVRNIIYLCTHRSLSVCNHCMKYKEVETRSCTAVSRGGVHCCCTWATHSSGIFVYCEYVILYTAVYCLVAKSLCVYHNGVRTRGKTSFLHFFFFFFLIWSPSGESVPRYICIYIYYRGMTITTP